MKYIVVGLGNFGASLSEKLTAQGHEVIGIDSRMEKVDFHKERISHTICMDATDEFAVSSLPIKDTDIIIISIGENEGANIMATAMFKNMKAPQLFSRAINALHEKVLEAIGIDGIVHPEEESAERWAKKLSLRNVVDSFELSDEYSIIEAEVPDDYVGRKIKDIGFREDFNLLVLTTIKRVDEKSAIGNVRSKNVVQGVASADLELNEEDILVLYGANRDLRRFLKAKGI